MMTILSAEMKSKISKKDARLFVGGIGIGIFGNIAANQIAKAWKESPSLGGENALGLIAIIICFAVAAYLICYVEKK
ncbi:hypothetical protein HYV43_00060 [Candidatus Micrarchaeota archaeon]|nr:hypothetical protein [Candidatus Micrarchaeota archaeon]